jgi:hypothetical protein
MVVTVGCCTCVIVPTEWQCGWRRADLAPHGMIVVAQGRVAKREIHSPLFTHARASVLAMGLREGEFDGH